MIIEIKDEDASFVKSLALSQVIKFPGPTTPQQRKLDKQGWRVYRAIEKQQSG